MLNNLACRVLNRLLQANPGVQNQLQLLAMKLIQLNTPFLKLSFQITPNGLLDPKNHQQFSRDCQINLPIGIASYLIHHNQLKAFGQIEISGDKLVAQKLLSALAELEYSNLLYQHNSLGLGIATIHAEALLKKLLSYLKLIGSNSGISVSHYLQYETTSVTDKYSLEKFYTQVDELKERSELLAKRVERLKP